MSATEKLRLTEQIVSSIGAAIKSGDTNDEIRDMFVDSCCFRQVACRWRDTENGFDLLQLAVYHKRLPIVKFLSKPQSKLTPWRPVHDEQGRVINNPFHLACYVGALDIIQYLLDSEVEFADMMLLRTEGYVCPTNTVRDTDQPKLPFEICIEQGSIECGMFLCHYVLSRRIYKDTPLKMAMLNASSLHQACHLGSGELLALLLNDPSSSCYINSHDSMGYTPLHIAAMCGDHQCLSILLQHNAYINAYCDCRSPLHILYSCKQRPEDFGKCTRVLISYGADVNASDHNENTPLDYVAYEFGQKLFKHNSHNLCTSYTHYDQRKLMEKTPVMKLGQYRRELLKTMNLLLDAGAHTYKIISHTQDGVLVDHTIIHTLLQNTGLPLSSCLVNNAAEVLEALALLFLAGCDPNVLAKHNLTSSFSMLLLHSLHEVCNLQLKLEYIHLFIQHGADLECIIPPPRHFRKHPTERIWSVPPLMLALQEKHPIEVISLMVNFMSLDFLHRMLRSAKMHNWLMYVLQPEQNKPYRKEWVAVKHKLRNRVRTLKHHCKLAVRCAMGKPVWEVEFLPIPKPLQEYIIGSDF